MVTGSNRRPAACKAAALPTELTTQCLAVGCIIEKLFWLSNLFSTFYKTAICLGKKKPIRLYFTQNPGQNSKINVQTSHVLIIR